MKSTVPKVLIDLLGRPLVAHVLEAARSLSPRSIVVIGGRHLPAIRTALANGPRSVVFARQPKPLGTAHAVRCGLKALARGGGQVLVLSGDVPLMRAETLRALVAEHKKRKASITVLTATVDDPSGLGRIVRGERGEIRAIVE